jgi:sulfate transport system ATP-binding protein
VPVLDSGARGATTAFVDRGIGDVLINWENEILLGGNELSKDKFEIVVPPSSPAIGYVRPHEIDLDRRADAAGAIEATIRRIQAVGAVARVEITRTDNGDILEGELSQERWRELALYPGERVFVGPKTVRVFPEPVE